MKPVQKVAVVVLRYYAPAVALLMLNHVVGLMVGYAHAWHEFFFDSSIAATVMLILASYAFGFCVWHRACVIYAWIVSVCIDYERQIGFGDWLSMARIVTIAAGVIILIMFVINCVRR